MEVMLATSEVVDEAFIPSPSVACLPASMSALSSLIGKTILGGINNKERSSADGLSHLRYVLETMPAQKKYAFQGTTNDVLHELYEAMWGQYPHYFLPPGVQSIVGQGLLSALQGQLYSADALVPGPGRTCARILQKGECCYRCK